MIRTGFASLALFLATTPANAEECAPFTWGSVDVGGIDISQGAIIVGVTIEGIGRDIPLQLDTGSATTELYGEAVPAEIMAAGKQPRSVRVEGWSGDGQSLPIAIRPAEGAAGQTVGTLGTDAFPEGFILDLEHQRICKMNVLNNDAIAGWQTLTLVKGSPVIEATEDGATIRLLLDTGSSGFSLLSTQALSSTVRSATPVQQLSVPSFGRMLNVTALKPSRSMAVMGKGLTLDRVYSFDDPDIEGMLKSAGISGLLGMQPFSDGALVFDFLGQRIGFGRLPK
jgi:hypothetical protein